MSIAELYGVDFFDTSTVQNHELGAVAYDQIGRKYRYVKAGAVALVKGNLLQSPARDTQFTDMTAAAAAVDATRITVTLGSTAIAANEFNDGVLVVSVTPGIGQTFSIRGHQVSAASVTCWFDINERVLTALTTSSRITASRGPYNGVIVSPTTRTGTTVGVAITAIPIAGFGFIGVEGMFGVLSDSSVSALGEDVSPSTTTAGCVTKQVTLLENIGSTPILGVSAQVEPVILKLP